MQAKGILKLLKSNFIIFSIEISRINVCCYFSQGVQVSERENHPADANGSGGGGAGNGAGASSSSQMEKRKHHDDVEPFKDVKRVSILLESSSREPSSSVVSRLLLSASLIFLHMCVCVCAQVQTKSEPP